MHIATLFGMRKDASAQPELSRASRFLLIRPHLGRHRHVQAGWMDGERILFEADAHLDLLSQVRAAIAEEDVSATAEPTTPRQRVTISFFGALGKTGRHVDPKRRASFVPIKRGELRRDITPPKLLTPLTIQVD